MQYVTKFKISVGEKVLINDYSTMKPTSAKYKERIKNMRK